MRHQQARQVGDIFTQHLLAIDAEIGKRAVAVKLRHQLRRRRVVLGRVFRGPPIAEAALGVVNIAQFVEAVADFVGDAGAGGAVVGGGVALAIEIGRLQDAGREKLGIGAEHDDCADDLRIDPPLVRIGRLS